MTPDTVVPMPHLEIRNCFEILPHPAIEQSHLWDKNIYILERLTCLEGESDACSKCPGTVSHDIKANIELKLIPPSVMESPIVAL